MKMPYLNFKSEYNRTPIIQIKKNDSNVYQGKEEIIHQLKNIKSGTIVFETYPGIDLNILKRDLIDPLNPNHIIWIEDFSKSELEINQMLDKNITDDRVFGLISHHNIEDLYHMEKIKTLNQKIKENQGLTIVYGFGASLVESNILIHVSLTRWEIQLRYRAGASNFKMKNPDEDILRKYKRGFFVEWRIADRIKNNIIDRLDYIIDYNLLDQPMMITKNLYIESIDSITKRPFRMVPYFDPGVWGGQWMKEVCNLDPTQPNYAWSFDGVPEENSIKLGFKDKIVEIPANDVVQLRPKELMGDRVHGRFGKHFPIRFDLLDTMGGGNLSLQVHPLTEYIYEKFGMPFTQDESYYILDAEKDGTVYLGFKENLDKENFIKDLKKSEQGDFDFPAEKYVNIFPAKKHDHFLIPAGTIHCSGKNTIVLEISATSYIFTFKLWDWGRLGLDGRPRPVHLEHGFKALQYDRTKGYVERELINHIKRVDEHEEITGLHPREFLETRRFKFKDSIDIETRGSVNMANLVDGKKAIIESVDGSFEPYEVHYAETFIIPSTIEKFRMRCLDESCMIIKAHVR
jgi:mannose-6-phosphate isomerase class I